MRHAEAAHAFRAATTSPMVWSVARPAWAWPEGNANISGRWGLDLGIVFSGLESTLSCHRSCRFFFSVSAFSSGTFFVIFDGARSMCG